MLSFKAFNLLNESDLYGVVVVTLHSSTFCSVCIFKAIVQTALEMVIGHTIARCTLPEIK